MRGKKWLAALAAAGILCAGGWFLYRSGFFAAAASLEGLQNYLADAAPYSHLCFFLLQLLSVVLAPIPSNISAAAGGALFGTWTAFLLTFSAVMAGSLLVFWLARVLGQGFADRLVSRRLSEKYQEMIRSKTSAFLALAFLFPFFPDDVLCILAGLTELPFRRFAVIALVTRPWGLLFACALGGASLKLPPWVMVPLGLAGLAVFALALRYSGTVERAVLRWLKKE